MSDDEGAGSGSAGEVGPADGGAAEPGATRDSAADGTNGDGPGHGTGDDASPEDVDPMDVETVDPEEVERLRRRVESFEADIEERTVHRDDLESDLQRYVRRKVRRSHARGWGPYLVLLYGTLMTLGAFYFLSGGWAILAMLVIWLSTLGLYVLMLIVGWVGTLVGLPGRLRDRVGDLRD
jgi:membrane protein